MKRLAGEKDYLCIAGKPSDITTNLNKINLIYDFTIIASDLKDGIVTVIIERRQKATSAGENNTE